MTDESQPSAPPKEEPRSGGFLRRVLVRAGLIFVVLYTGVFFQLNDRRLGAMVSWLVTRSVRGTFTLGRAHYDYFGGLWSILTNRPTHVTGGDFEMVDPDGNVVMRVPHVEAEVHLQELIVSLVRYGATRHFNLKLHFSHATLPGGFAVIAPTRTSFGGAKPEMNIVATMSGKKPPTDDQGNFQIAVDAIDLGPIDFALASSNPIGQTSWSGRLEGARGRASLYYSSAKRRATPDGPAFFFALRDVDVPAGQLVLGDYLFPLEGLHVTYFGTVPTPEGPGLAPGAPAGYGARQELAFLAEGKSYEGHVRAIGALTDAYSNHTGVRLRLELEHGVGLARLLPDPVSSWVSGDPRGAVVIQGPFTNITIGGELDGAVVDLVGLHLTRASGRFQLLDKGLLRLEGLKADLGNGQVRGKLDVKLAQRGSWRAEIDASGVDPSALRPVPPSARAVLAGRFGGKLKLGGGFGGAPGGAPGGVIDIEVASATLERRAHDGLPKHVELAGTLAVVGEHVDMRTMSLHGEGLSLDASGEVVLSATPRAALDFSLAAGTGPWIGRLGLPSDMQLEHVNARGRVDGPLVGLEGAAHLALRGLVVSGRRVDRAEAELELSGGKLRIGALSGQGLGAGLAGHGTLRLFEVDSAGRTRLDRRAPAEIDANLKAQGANLSEVAGTVAVVGAADLDVALKGPLAHPSGSAAVDVPELSLLGDHYRKGRVAFDFSDAGAKVSALHLERADGGKLEGRGGVSWDGALDLDLDPHDFPLAAIPGVSSLPVAVLGTISGKMHLGGDLSRPEPGGVISLVGAKIRDTFFGDGSLKIEPGPDAIHITGRFFQNYDIDGYLTLFPKLSVAVTVKFSDIELEKLFPELRSLAEVRGRATGQARLTADADAGLTFAELRLAQVSLVLAGLDETGHARRLVVRNEEDVTLSTDGHELVVERCALRSALGAFSIVGRISKHDTAVALRGQIGLELLEYFFSSFFQHMHGDALVDLAIRGDLTQKPSLLGTIDLRRALLQPRGLEHRLFVPSGVVEFQADGLRVRNLKIELDGAVAQASGRIALTGYTPGAISGEVSGELSPKLLQWVLPDQIDDASGRLALRVSLAGTWQRPEWRGEAQIQDTRVSLRRTAREIAIHEGTFRFSGHDIALGCGESGDRAACRSISGLVDDESRFSVDGRLGFGEGLFLRAISVKLDASDLGYNAGDFSVRVSPSVELTGDGKHLMVAGTVNVIEGRYSLPFDLLTDLLFRPRRTTERPVPFWEGIPLLEDMKLDLRARTTGPFLVRNNIADLSFSADLQLGGTLKSITIGGTATVDPGGTINLQVCRFPFQTERSQITFDPEKRYPETPTLHVSATGILVSDRSDAVQTQNINIQLVGPLSSPQLIASTQQGAQGADVLTMCVTGRTGDEIRRGVSPGQAGTAGATPAMGSVQRTTTTEGVAKGASGALMASAIDPLRKVAHLDTLSLEFGATGVDIQACKRWTRGFKTCGLSEIGFISGTRVGGFAEYRITDQLSVLGRGEYLTRGLETVQDSLTRGRLELNLKFPLIW